LRAPTPRIIAVSGKDCILGSASPLGENYAITISPKKPPMKPKRISVSDLAGMVKHGFDEVQGELRDLRQEVGDIRAETNHRVNAVEYQQRQPPRPT
jgi:hypothetical protein